MDQEKIGNLIRDIRKKNNLTQAEFASKYGITYQAVSKWENGKNIPDIMLLKEICNDYDIDINSLLGNSSNKKKSLFIYILVLLLLVIVLVLGIVFIDNDDFEFKTLSANCKDFTISGSMAYNSNKSSIYISNINYCGGEDNSLYNSIKCSLYESNGNTERHIDEYNYNGDGILLADFLKGVNFHIDNYKSSCKNYTENSLYLLVNADKVDSDSIIYKIPLVLESNCK